VVNPRALEATISANLVQSLGRTMKEEVAFDTRTATSADWLSYPVARARDVPSAIDVVLIARADVAPTGAGEAASRPTAAAIGNAIFDACAARVRQVPFTSARVKAVLARPQPAGTGG
jgi:CO/xanthine dehydrogenase Mo-binding subunit